MPKTRIQKEEIVTKISEKLEKANSIVFTDYKGLNMSQLSDLRNKLREVSAEFNITKNNLLKLALQKSNIEYPTSLYEGPVATMFAYGDELDPIKILTKALKDNAIGTIKLGLWEGEVIDTIKINKLASLPSKDELRAKTIGVLVAPLHGIVGVLQANLRNLVYALEQIRQSKGGEQNSV